MTQLSTGAPTQLNLTDADHDLIAAFAGCSLDDSPGSNWVQNAGGLPSFICEVARAIKRTGKTTSEAIAIAVSRMKVWASGKGVDKDTQAKAAKALAEWEAKRAKSHAKSAAKKTVKATAVEDNFTDLQLLRLWALEPACELSATQKVLETIRFQGPALDRILNLAKGTDSKAKPYGDVSYADPKNNKYPIDTVAHVRAAWSYINMPKNRAAYNGQELEAIEAKIKAAAKRFGIEISDD